MGKMVVLVLWLLMQLAVSSTGAPTNSGRRPSFENVTNGINTFSNAVAAICSILNIFGTSACSPRPSSSLYRDVEPLQGKAGPIDISSGTRLMSFYVGDTRQQIRLIADTTTDLTFFLCQPCMDCSLEASVPVYNSSESSTFTHYTCGSERSTTDTCLSSRYTKCAPDGSCMYTYDDYPAITSEGFLAMDSFFSSNTDHASAVPIVFGCGTSDTGYFGTAAGYIGLGLGNLSFVSQSNISKFSYCFSSDSADDSYFFFGSDVRLQTASSTSTKLLPNKCDPALYYVNMTGISVGGKRVDIPSAAYLPQPDGRGGMVIDSASSLTLLEESAYQAMKLEFIKQMQLPQADASVYNLDLCFAISNDNDDRGEAIPELTLHFDGADMNPSNYFMKDSDGNSLCLMVIPADGISILGNLIQMDMQMVFDIGNSVLQFESVNCRSL